MTTNFHTDDASAGETPRVDAGAAGFVLRQAREAAGLTLDAVAQQLKLAPRQVDALEQGDYSRLPGRTFVRGFVRNYARLMHLDADALLAALPGSAAAPSLDAPTLQSTSTSFGELPSSGKGGRSWARIVIPLGLLGIVAAAAVYEFTRPNGGVAERGAPREAAAPPSNGTPATVALPNPVAVEAPAPSSSTIAPPGAAVVPTTPAPAAPSAASTGAAQPAAAAQAPTQVTLVVAFRDFSWTEVRERGGRVLLAKMMAGGQSQTLVGSPPFDIVIGNASDVTLTYNGRRVDLAPVSRGNVARFSLE